MEKEISFVHILTWTNDFGDKNKENCNEFRKIL